MTGFEQQVLKRVILAADVYAMCLQHALTTEKEEIMGLLIGEVDEAAGISHITACVILHRSDKQPDRVEISPEQLCTASIHAEHLEQKLKRPMRVLGWYHSHPHITVWPSHVDVRTQSIYQIMDPLFVGLIFSVYQSDKGAVGNQIQLTCFQAVNVGSSVERREVPVVVKASPLEYYNLQGIAELPHILVQEEVQTHNEETTDIQDHLAKLHNEAYKTLTLVHLMSKVTRPMCDGLEVRINSINERIREMESVRKKLTDAIS